MRLPLAIIPLLVIGILLPPCVMMMSKDLVTLKLKATGCEHSCTEYVDNKTCPSSINVDGREVSHQLDGFNIAIINNKDGRIEKKHYRWGNFDEPQVNHLISSIKKSAMIVVVFQKMCGYFSSKWYEFFLKHSDLKLVNLKKNNYYISIAVMCKYSCPKTSEGSIPFFYTGPDTQKEYELSISFLPGTSAIQDGDVLKKLGDEEMSIGTIIGVLAGAAVIIVILVALLKYTITRTRNYGAQKQYDRPPGVESMSESRNNAHAHSQCATSDQTSEPHYEELGDYNMTKVDKKQNVYVDQRDIMQYSNNYGNNSHHSNNGHVSPLYAQSERMRVRTQPTAPPLTYA